MVARISVPWATVRLSSARSSCSRSNPSIRDKSPTYIEGAYWAWSVPIRSRTLGIEPFDALEEHLASEQGPVQLLFIQNPRHGTSAGRCD